MLEIAKTTPIRLVPLSDNIVSSLSAERPYLAPSVIPAGAYPGVGADVPTLDIGTQLIVRADLDEALVRRIVSSIWSQRTRRLLDEGHPKGSQVRLESALKGIAIPVHDGAAQYYREAGLMGQ